MVPWKARCKASRAAWKLRADIMKELAGAPAEGSSAEPESCEWEEDFKAFAIKDQRFVRKEDAE
jgi:hypothetical protein